MTIEERLEKMAELQEQIKELQRQSRALDPYYHCSCHVGYPNELKGNRCKAWEYQGYVGSKFHCRRLKENVTEE